jgi:hypothetical protein
MSVSAKPNKSAWLLIALTAWPKLRTPAEPRVPSQARTASLVRSPYLPTRATIVASAATGRGIYASVMIERIAQRRIERAMGYFCEQWPRFTTFTKSSLNPAIRLVERLNRIVGLRSEGNVSLYRSVAREGSLPGTVNSRDSLCFHKAMPHGDPSDYAALFCAVTGLFTVFEPTIWYVLRARSSWSSWSMRVSRWRSKMIGTLNATRVFTATRVEDA